MAVRILDRPNPVTRRKPLTIILNEHHHSVASPETHVEGLIPFSIENSRLRFLMHSSFETNLAPSLWRYVNTVNSGIYGRGAKAVDYWPGFLGWLVEISFLASRGMPAGSFTLSLEVRSGASISLWRQIARSATKRAILPKWTQQLDPDVTDFFLSFHMFSITCAHPKMLPLIIRDTHRGTSSMQLSGVPVARVWNESGEIEGSRRWSVDI